MLHAHQTSSRIDPSQEVDPAEEPFEAWVLQNMLADTLLIKLHGGQESQLDAVLTVLNRMYYMVNFEGFWFRHGLPEQIDAMDRKIQKTERQLLRYMEIFDQ